MRKLFFILIMLNISLTSFSQWNPWKDVTEFVGGAVKTSIQVLTVPTETVAKAAGVVIGANKPEDIFQPYKNLANSQGDLINKATPFVELANAPQKILLAKAQEYSKQIGGPAGEFLFDIGTFSQRFYTNMAPSGAKAIAQALKGENPLVIVAAPLAAAIQAGKEKHQLNSKPLPEDVKIGLKDIFSQEILNKALYTVGKVDITLPNFIGQGKKFMGDHYAVVVDNIIVFNTTPPSFKNGAWWWAHEITHIQQYTSLGLEIFSYKYLKDFGKSIESEADANADRVYLNSQGTTTLIPLTQIYKPTRQAYLGQELIVTQCIFDNDSTAASYVVTNKGKIFAVNPLNGKYFHVGFTKSPVFAGTEWTFSTSKVKFSVMANGDIVKHIPIKNPQGSIIGYQALKVGHTVKLE